MGAACFSEPPRSLGTNVNDVSNNNQSVNNAQSGNNIGTSNGQTRMDRPPSHSHLDLSNMRDSNSNQNGANAAQVSRRDRLISETMKKYRKYDESSRKLLYVFSLV